MIILSSQERRTLNSRLYRTHRIISPVLADGNCLFRAISLALYHTQDNHNQIRAQIVDYIASHTVQYTEYRDTDASLEDTITELRRPGTWGGYMCIHAAAMFFKSIIYVHSLTSPTYRFEGGNDHIIHLAYLARSHFDLIQYTADGGADDDIEETEKEDFHNSLEPLTRSNMARYILDATDDRIECQKPFSIIQLAQTTFSSVASSLAYLKEKSILNENAICPRCNAKLSLRPPYSEHPVGAWRCSECDSSLSPFGGTLLAKTKLPLDTFILLALGWLRNKPYTEQLADFSISERALSTFNQRMNAFAKTVLAKKKTKIGGSMVIVEIDEALLHRRKNFIGRMKTAGWVLGGVERPHSPDCIPRTFFAECEQRTREQLERLILENVELGSIIITDSFSSYSGLNLLGYHHYTVNHSKNFVDPDSQAHTQRIEGLWRQLRRSLPSTGTRFDQLSGYLAAFVYRRRVSNQMDVFLKELMETDLREIEENISKKSSQNDKSPLESSPQSSTPPPTSPLSDLNPSSPATPTKWTRASRTNQRMHLYSSDPEVTARNLIADSVRSPTRRRKIESMRDSVFTPPPALELPEGFHLSSCSGDESYSEPSELVEEVEEGEIVRPRKGNV